MHGITGINLAASQAGTNYNFGEQTSKIRGSTYVDTNGNGQRAAGRNPGKNPLFGRQPPGHVFRSRLPDRPQADYLPRLPEPGALTRAQAERQYVQAMLAHHDAVEQLARRAEGVRLRPALKTLLETVRARSQAERLALQARLDALP